jgi:hypothetical protein
MILPAKQGHIYSRIRFNFNYSFLISTRNPPVFSKCYFSWFKLIEAQLPHKEMQIW